LGRAEAVVVAADDDDDDDEDPYTPPSSDGKLSALVRLAPGRRETTTTITS